MQKQSLSPWVTAKKAAHQMPSLNDVTHRHYIRIELFYYSLWYTSFISPKSRPQSGLSGWSPWWIACTLEPTEFSISWKSLLWLHHLFSVPFSDMHTGSSLSCSFFLKLNFVLLEVHPCYWPLVQKNNLLKDSYGNSVVSSHLPPRLMGMNCRTHP